jgi:hypothetical protein
VKCIPILIIANRRHRSLFGGEVVAYVRKQALKCWLLEQAKKRGNY